MIVVMALVFVKKCKSEFEYEAIFNFGDSSSDTSGYFTMFSGRSSNGRLIIDFILYIFLNKYTQTWH
jgi:hypothetical protein